MAESAQDQVNRIAAAGATARIEVTEHVPVTIGGRVLMREVRRVVEEEPEAERPPPPPLRGFGWDESYLDSWEASRSVHRAPTDKDIAEARDVLAALRDHLAGGPRGAGGSSVARAPPVSAETDPVLATARKGHQIWIVDAVLDSVRIRGAHTAGGGGIVDIRSELCRAGMHEMSRSTPDLLRFRMDVGGTGWAELRVTIAGVGDTATAARWEWLGHEHGDAADEDSGASRR